MMDSEKHRYFGFQEPDEEKKKELVEKLKNGIPDNMLVLGIQSDGTMREVTNDTGRIGTDSRGSDPAGF